MDIEQLAGTRLGNYEIESLLGRGGMGVVYKARQISLDRPVALKILPPSLSADPSYIKRFRREAQAVAKLSHPNIAQIHDIAEESSLHFFSMEYIEGQSLDNLLKDKGRFEIPEAARVVIQVAQGIEHAHKNNIIHRDIKPSNIILDSLDNVKVMDFGLARSTEERSKLTESGTLMGTLDYMSPEQCKGEELDERTDIYSLGVMLYEMLTGRVPFEAPNEAALIHRIVNEKPEDIRNLMPNIPTSLNSIMMRAMAKSRDDRYDSASAFSKDVQNLAASFTKRIESRTRSKNGRSRSALAGRRSASPVIQRTAFVGRETELNRLLEILDSSALGTGALAMIGGEPGVGKTRITEELTSKAQQKGFLTLVGHCYEMEGAPAYIPFVELIESAARIVEPDALRNALGDSAPEIAKLMPELRQQFPDIPTPVMLPPEQERRFMFNGILDFITRAAYIQPLLLVFEDLHWADESTMLLLQHIAQQLPGISVLAVGTYRDTELDVARPLADALEELLRQRMAYDLILKRLPQSDVAIMLRGKGEQEPPCRIVDLVYRETEGNPFFVEEVFKHLTEEGKLFDAEGHWHSDLVIGEDEVPRGVRLVIGRRLERVSEDCRKILNAAAVIGRGFSFELLEKIVDLSEDSLLDAIEEAEGAQLISSKAEGSISRFIFSHELIRQTLISSLSWPRRRRIHLRVAEAMERRHLGALDEHAADLAYHYYQSGSESNKTIDYAFMAGNRAVSQAAYEEAVAQYQRALEELELQHPADKVRRCDVMLALGNTLTMAGDPTRAEKILLSTIDLARKLRAPEQLVEALSTAGHIRFASGMADEFILDLAEEGLSIMPEGDSIPKARLMAFLSNFYVFAEGFMERRITLSEQAIAMARRLGDKQSIKEALWSQAMLWKRSIRERIADLKEVLELSEESGDFSFVALALCHLCSNYTELGDLSSADAAQAKLRELSKELSLPISLFILRAVEAMRALMAGRFDEAERLGFETFAEGQKWNEKNTPLHFAGFMFALRFMQGRLAEIDETLHSQMEMYPNLVSFRTGSALLHFYLGREEQARSEFENLAKGDFKNIPQDYLTMSVLSQLSILTCRFGDTRRATLLYDLLTPHSEHLLMIGSPVACLGSVKHFLGMLAGTLQRWDDAAEHFETALETNARIGARPHLALTQQEYARLLVKRNASGDKEKAKKLLTESTTICQELGMPSFLIEAKELMEQL